MKPELEVASMAIGIVGSIISFCLFAAPIPTIIRIVKKKSVEGFKSDPYLAATMNCIFLIVYSLLCIHPESTILLTINSIGIAMEFCYLIIFFIYSDNRERRWIVGWLVVFTAWIFSPATKRFLFDTEKSNFFGGFCVAFGILLYASPLTIMKKVTVTRSVEYMPLWLSVASFFNGVIWTVYSCLIIDPFMFAGNLIGTLLGATQLVLYWYYPMETPKTPGGKHHTPNQGQVQKENKEITEFCSPKTWPWNEDMFKNFGFLYHRLKRQHQYDDNVLDTNLAESLGVDIQEITLIRVSYESVVPSLYACGGLSTLDDIMDGIAAGESTSQNGKIALLYLEHGTADVDRAIIDKKIADDLGIHPLEVAVVRVFYEIAFVTFNDIGDLEAVKDICAGAREITADL